MCATVSLVSVQSPTCAPRRAAASASQPACPAPMTMTSKRSFMSQRSRRTRVGAIPRKLGEHFFFACPSCPSCLRGLGRESFADTKARENMLEQIFRARRPLISSKAARLCEVGEHELLDDEPPSARAASRARSSAPWARSTSAMCRTLVIAGRSRSGSTSIAAAMRWRNSSRPAPVVADTHTARSSSHSGIRSVLFAT